MRQITILSRNKSHFAAKESVHLHIEFKNIERCTMRVYAINLLNYYKEKLAPFDEQLALEGIEPQYLEELNLASS